MNRYGLRRLTTVESRGDNLNRTLFTVGPVEVRKEVLEAMTKPMMTHRGKDYEQLQAGVVEKLHKTLDTDMNIMMSPSSASGLLEACVRCGVNSNMVGISNGSFGNRWQSIGTENGRNVKKINVEWGKAVRAEHLAGQIDDSTEAVTMIANESSTGVLNPVQELSDAIRSQHDPLIFIDAVTAAYGSDMHLKKLDADAVVFGTQKALALPPGLAVICCSDRLLKKAETVPNRGYYFDLLHMKKMADKHFSLTTPPVSLLYGLDYQLDRILKEGVQNRYARHQEMADTVHAWAEKKLGLFAEEGFRSKTISVICKKGLDFGKLQSKLNERGFEISNGYGDVKDTTFRIGHMGDLTVPEIKGLLKNIDEILEELQ